ncbi:hypothetical protein Q8A67_011984 [Cirrhinus molitorella]|uniref:Uncharacterized protein n=1 Tax=Cirrhinus molitorella TaxID=172907 RepID=A0AA88TNH1_9TELE|nr:hypothetical protein Q8A67_011984 [Cirrhinus molitorella]
MKRSQQVALRLHAGKTNEWTLSASYKRCWFRFNSLSETLEGKTYLRDKPVQAEKSPQTSQLLLRWMCKVESSLLLSVMTFRRKHVQ